MPGFARVSVVIPAYNHERFVGEAIDSALAQTHADLEVVVIDDGSGDATAAVAEERARRDARVRVIRQANAGSHAAINRGIAESHAPWIAILNSDDRYAPTRIERLLARCGDDHDFAVTGVRLIDADGAPITDPGHWLVRTLADFGTKADALGPVDGLLYGNYTVSTSNFFVRRGLFERIGAFRHLRHVLDWDFALRAVLHAPARFAWLRDEPLLDYRLHGGNAILRDFTRGALEMASLHRRLLPRFGVPHGLVASLFRAQRDLRRGARDRATARADVFVREREADVARLQAQCSTLEAALREREADVARLHASLDEANARRDTLAAELRARDARVDELAAALRTHERELRAREQDLRTIRATLTWRLHTRLDRLLRGRA